MTQKEEGGQEDKDNVIHLESCGLIYIVDKE
jgi:hypothetical protein